jgi:hypothetical protein
MRSCALILNNTHNTMDEISKNEIRQHLDELRRLREMIDQLINAKIRELLAVLDKVDDKDRG